MEHRSISRNFRLLFPTDTLPALPALPAFLAFLAAGGWH